MPPELADYGRKPFTKCPHAGLYVDTGFYVSWAMLTMRDIIIMVLYRTTFKLISHLSKLDQQRARTDALFHTNN